MRLQVAVLTLFGSLAFVSAAGSAATADCLNGLGPTLLADGFSGSLDCQNDQLSVQYIGEVEKFGRTFQIYAYQYRLKPVCPRVRNSRWAADHIHGTRPLRGPIQARSCARHHATWRLGVPAD